MSGNPGINNIIPVTGRVLKSDGTILEIADILFSIYDIVGNPSLVTLDEPHDQIHDGNYYTVSNNYIGVTNNSYADFHILTGSKAVHSTFTVVSLGEAITDLYRGTTYTNAGTPVPVFNNNEISSNVAIFTAKSHPVINVLGTNIFESLINGGTGAASVGGIQSYRIERILAHNQDYLLRVQNISGSSKDICIIFEGYEV